MDFKEKLALSMINPFKHEKIIHVNFGIISV